MILMKMILYFILTSGILINSIYSRTIRDKLREDLFKNYDSDIRPYCNNNTAVNVTLDMALRQLIEVNEPLEIIKANVWIRMKWTDCRLRWNASDYADIRNILVPFAKLWVPDLTLYDNTRETLFGKKEFTPNIFSDGTVYYNFPSVVDNRCIIDITKFPYDSQVCKFVFGSWAYHGEEIDFVQKNPDGDLTKLEENVEWDITSMTSERHVIYYNCCPEPYPDITFYVNMERKPGFYIINILIPYFMITGIAFFGFLLPCESGEKVSLEITVMLSLAVFQTLVADSLPPSSDNVPLIAIYFDFSMLLVAFATIIAVVVNNLYYRENQKIPKVIKVIFLDYGCKITFVQNPRVKLEKDKTNAKVKDNTNSDNKVEEKPKIINKNVIKEEKQFSKLKLCCTWLCSIFCGCKKPNKLSKPTKTITKPGTVLVNNKIGYDIEQKQKDQPFGTPNGLFKTLPPTSTTRSSDKHTDLSEEKKESHEIKDFKFPYNDQNNHRATACNGEVPGTDEIEEILSLPDYKNNMQNNEVQPNITPKGSVSMRPRHLPSTSITDEPNNQRKNPAYTKQNNHITSEEQRNKIDVKTYEQTSGKQTSHTDTEEQLDKIERTLEHIDVKLSRSVEWKALAVVVDRLSCYCFIVVGMIGLIVISVLLH